MNGSSNTASSGRVIVTAVGFLLIAGFFLRTEHRAHLFGILPFLLILLACPLLHLFMHGGHRGHADQSDDQRPPGWRSRADPSSHGRSAGGAQ
jgi:hypothetical protein